MTRAGQFSYPAIETVVFGRPAGEVVREQIAAAGCDRVFVLSGKSLAALADGPLQKIRAELGGGIVGEFNGVRAHTPREDVIAASNLARAAGADVLLAVGGGSVIDATKAALLCLWMGLDRPEQMTSYHDKASQPLRIVAPARPVRMISVSTTLSAADFTPMAGVTDTATRIKQAFAHRLFAPSAVVLDPCCLLDTPLALLRATAVRSVDHAVETFCSPWANPATEPACLQGLRLLASALRAMVEPPLDTAVLLDAQFGMWQSIHAAMSGVPTGASHGIGYVLGSGFGMVHGETSCVMLPAVLQWNAAEGDSKQARLSEAMGRPGQAASVAVRELVAGLGMPTRLRDVGIQRGDFDEIARRALLYPQLASNPTPVTSVEQVRQILEIAW